jgi:NADH-ubiquinone oxidoreductase chain 6
MQTNGFRVEILDTLYIICILLGIFTIISKNPIISVLYLIGLFAGISVTLILLGLVFIGISYLLVYIGAVSILFLFILMLINIRISELVSSNNNYLPLAVISVITLIYILGDRLSLNNLKISYLNFLPKVYSENFEYSFKEVLNFSNGVNWDTTLIDVTHISAIGNIMYSSYSMWLIVVSLILLLSMVGAIVINIKEEK